MTAEDTSLNSGNSSNNGRPGHGAVYRGGQEANGNLGLVVGRLQKSGPQEEPMGGSVHGAVSGLSGLGRKRSAEDGYVDGFAKSVLLQGSASLGGSNMKLGIVALLGHDICLKIDKIVTYDE